MIKKTQPFPDIDGQNRTRSPDSDSHHSIDQEVEEQDNFDSVFTVIMIGDSGVGKTDLIGRLCQSDDFKTKFFATIGINMESHVLDLDGHRSKLQIWDPSGSERFRRVVTQYFPVAKGIIFVYDVNYEKSFQSIQDWIQLVQGYADIDPFLPKCLIGNKCDMGDKRRKVTVTEGETLAASYGMRFFETSCLTGSNVRESFTSLCQDMLKRAERIPNNPINVP